MDAWRRPEQKAEIQRRKAAIRRQIKREVLAEFGLDKPPTRGDRKLIWWTVPTLDKAEEQLADYRRMATPASVPAMVVRGRHGQDRRGAAPGGPSGETGRERGRCC